MNKYAQSGNIAVVFMLAVVVIILAIAFAYPTNQITKLAMANSSEGIGEDGGMDCSNSSISDFTKAGCLVTDLGQGYFIGSIMAIAGIIIGAKVMFQ
jgi:hypothetical protein